MNARILSPEESVTRLEFLGLPLIGPAMRPDDAQIVVVEDKGRIVATMAVIRVVHYENCWVDPEYRANAGAVRKLLRAAKDAARKWAPMWIWGASDTDHVEVLLKKLGGVKMDVKSFALPVEGT